LAQPLTAASTKTIASKQQFLTIISSPFGYNRLTLKHLLWLLPFFLQAIPAFGYQLILKDGKIVEGKLIRELGDTLILKDSSGILINIRKEDVDQEKTAKANVAETKKQESKTQTRVVTKEYLESLRDKYDLGEGTFGETSVIEFSEEPGGFSAEEDSDFQEKVLEARMPVIVDFWAPWCGPCRKIAPELDAVEKEFDKTVRVYRVNVDQNPKLAGFYGVRAIPTLLYFNEGKIVDRIVGVASREIITRKLEALL
jgi:thioredoxin 1